METEEHDAREFEHVVLEGDEALAYRRPGWDLIECQWPLSYVR